MIEISLNNITKSYGFSNVLNELSIEIKTGDKIALIGENGSGKSTVLKIINKDEGIDKGIVSIRNGSTVEYLSQQPDLSYSNMIVKDILYNSFNDINKLDKSLKKYEEKMKKDPNNISLINKYLTIQDKYMKMGGYEINSLIDKVASGIKIVDLLNKEFDKLSGGEQKKVLLALLIIKNPSIMLLDEPTNHLDIDSLEWLEDYLKKYNGTIIIVSHDRYFLDKVVNKTILLENGKAILFYGNYSYYLKENALRIENEFKDYKDQQKLIAALKKKIKQLEDFGKLAYPGGEPFFRRAENIRKRLERIELKDKPVIKQELPMNFIFNKRSGKDALVVSNYDLFINSSILIENICFTINYGDKVCLIGNNGCGKTTLLKEIINNCSDKIKIGSNVKLGYIEQQIVFEKDYTILDYARLYYSGDDSNLRSALSKFYFYGNNIFKKLSKLSGGEKVRLKLFILIQEKCNFIIFDEPTNHIDIFTKESLENALKEFKGTVLFVSHDRYFINNLADKILCINNNKIIEYNGNYDYFIEHNK